MRQQAKPFAVEVKRTRKLSGEKQPTKPQGWADAYLMPSESEAKPSAAPNLLVDQPRKTNAGAEPGLALQPVPRRILPDLTATEMPALRPDNAPRSKKRISPIRESAATLSPAQAEAIDTRSSSQQPRSPSGPAKSSESAILAQKHVRPRERIVDQPAKIKKATEPSKQSDIPLDPHEPTRKPRRISPRRSAGANRPGERWKRRLPAVCR